MCNCVIFGGSEVKSMFFDISHDKVSTIMERFTYHFVVENFHPRLPDNWHPLQKSKEQIVIKVLDIPCLIFNSWSKS